MLKKYFLFIFFSFMTFFCGMFFISNNDEIIKNSNDSVGADYSININANFFGSDKYAGVNIKIKYTLGSQKGELYINNNSPLDQNGTYKLSIHSSSTTNSIKITDIDPNTFLHNSDGSYIYNLTRTTAYVRSNTGRTVYSNGDFNFINQQINVNAYSGESSFTVDINFYYKTFIPLIWNNEDGERNNCNTSFLYNSYTNEINLFASGDTPVEKLTLPSKPDCIFIGYFTENYEGDKVIDENGKITQNWFWRYGRKPKLQPLYAQFAQEYITVDFDAKNYVPLWYTSNIHTNLCSVENSKEIINNEFIATFTIINTQNNWSGVWIDLKEKLTVGKEYDWQIDLKSTHSHGMQAVGPEQGGYIQTNISTDWTTIKGTFIAVDWHSTFVIYSNNLSVGEKISFKNVTVQERDVSVTPSDNAIPSYIYNYNGFYTNLPIPEQKGYIFDGWWTLPKGGEQITSNTKVISRVDHMLYSHWIPQNFTLTFDPCGGEVEFGTKSVTYGEAYGNFPTVKKTGYIFKGWWTSLEGGDQISETSIYNQKGPQTLYAHWEANTYQITFDEQGGDTNYVDMSSCKSGTITNNGSVTTLVTGGLTYTYDTSTNILTVNGTQTASTVFSFAIINDLVAGDEYTLTMEYISGTPYTTNGCEVLEVYNKSIQTLPERNKYDFNFPASGKTSITLKITEYAQENGYALACRMWRNTENRVFNNYKVKFTITQKTGEAKKVRDVKYDSVLTPVSIPTKYGYNFAGYYTQANGQGTQHYDSTGKAFNNKTWDIADNTTLYAKWVEKTDCKIFYESEVVGNMENWTKTTYGERINVSYNKITGINNINFFGKGGWETIAIPLYFSTLNKQYTISYNYYGEYEILSGYTNLRMQLLNSVPTDGTNIEKQVAYADMLSIKNGQVRTATIKVTPSQNIYYLTLNLGYIADGKEFNLFLCDFNIIGENNLQVKAIQYVSYDTKIGQMYWYSKPGYIFNGWFSAPVGGEKLSENFIMDSEIKTAYSRWTETWATEGNFSNNLSYDYSDGYYKITSAQDLARLIYLINYTSRSDVLNYKYKLTNHINLSTYYWEPIGTTNRPFSSIFNGMGFTIYGLHTISQSDRGDYGETNVGLFGYTSGAIIKNVYIEGGEINGLNNVGGIVGNATTKSSANGTVYTTIVSCGFNGEIESAGTKGGIVGYATSTIIKDCLVIMKNEISSTTKLNICGSNGLIDSCKIYINGMERSTNGNFENWIKVEGMQISLPKGLAWIAGEDTGFVMTEDMKKLAGATNLIPNGDMEGTGWYGDNMSYSKEYAYSGEYSIKVTGRNYRETLTYTSTGIYLDTSHKYYFSVYTYQETRTATTIQCYWPEAEPALMTAQIKEAGEWQMYSVVAERTNGGLSGFNQKSNKLRLDFDNKYVQDVIYFDNAILIDLTEVFGAGNEPSQVWLDQYAYLIKLF